MEEPELLLLGGEINASTVSDALTPSLEKVLLEAQDAGTAARKIAAVPALMAEVKEKVNLVTRLASPIGSDGVYIALQPCLIMWGPPDFGSDKEADAMAKAWIDIYAKALKDLPKEALEIAVSEWFRTGKPYFPRPTELNKLAQETAAEIRLIAWRMRKAAEYVEKKTPVERTPEDVEKVKAMIAEMRGPDGRIQLGRSMPQGH